MGSLNRRVAATWYESVREQRLAPNATKELLSIVYEELRQLATARLQRERAGQTLQPTALVHEAFLRLVDSTEQQTWDSPGHFFAAAAEAMRRILVERARAKQSGKRGGGRKKISLDLFVKMQALG